MMKRKEKKNDGETITEPKDSAALFACPICFEPLIRLCGTGFVRAASRFGTAPSPFHAFRCRSSFVANVEVSTFRTVLPLSHTPITCFVYLE
ncbi:hypothetical protein Hanom_Chr00s022212g01761461 [Helianthus anomalus]